VLEGSVRRFGQHIRVSTQLVDAASANQIWAERYAMELTEVFAVQDAIAERVAGAIEPELLKTESLPAAAQRKRDCLGPGAARYLAFSSRRPANSLECPEPIQGGVQARP
jgi:hypothetical protein